MVQTAAKVFWIKKRIHGLVPDTFSEVPNGLEGPNPFDHPGPIDNTKLFVEKWINGKQQRKTKSELRKNVIDRIDYEIIVKEPCILLMEEFGLTSGQEPLDRKVIEDGLYNKMLKL